jgi:hypothetical protein
MCEKIGKSRKIVFFPIIRGSGGSKSRLAKAAGAEPSFQIRIKIINEKKKSLKHLIFGPFLEITMSKKYTTLWYETYFKIKINKTYQDKKIEMLRAM